MRSRKTKSLFPVVLWFVLAISLVFGVPGGASAEPATVAVLYPEIREPYRSVFLNIVKGIEDSIKGTAKQYVLKEGDSLSALKNGLESEHVQVVIALGTSGLAAAQQLPDRLRTVVGAVLMPPTENVRGVTGITL
ncbi:MAG: ABC transporter substrate-binding protein, partial [Pyrinomonadaceae bacterium]